MANIVLHKDQSSKPAAADTSKIDGPKWNKEHAFAGGSDNNVLVRDSGQTDGAAWSGAPTVSGANISALNASALASGTVPDGRFPATLPAASGANLTSLPAANVTGTLPNTQIVAAGTGAETARLGGVLPDSVSTAVVGTDANTNEKDLYTYPLKANALSADGRGVRITAWGSTAANGNNKTIKLYFGTTIVATRSGAYNGQDWALWAVVFRTSATTQSSFGQGSVNSDDRNTVASPGATLSGAVTIKVTGQNGTGTQNDIVVKGAFVELLN